MCLNPIHISNNTYRFVPGKSKLSFDVPCCNCDDCRSHKKNEWFLRCYSEFLQNKKSGGVTFFLTLTYADEFLPHFDYHYKSIVNGEIVIKHITSPCFSYDDIHTFINSLRVILKRNVPGVKLRYIVFSEYGEHTQRPHYHILLYLSQDIPDRLFYSFVDGYDNDHERRKFHKWSKDLPYFKTRNTPTGIHQRGAWHKGWVLVSKPSAGGMRVQSQKSILYCSKYVTKDLCFYHKDDVRDFLESIQDPSLYSESESLSLLSEVRRLLPRHYNSPSLGFDWLKSKFLSDYNKYINEGFTIQVGLKDSVSYKLPDYYKRKILYRYQVDVDSDGRKHVTWFYNPDFKNVHLAYLRHHIANYINRLEVVTSVDFVNSLQSDDLAFIGFTRNALIDYFQSIKSRFSFLDIAVFNFVFHGRSCRYDCLDGSYNPDYPLSFYVSHYSDYYIHHLDNVDDSSYNYSYLKYHKDDYNYTYDTKYCFCGLSEFVEIVNHLLMFVKDYELNFRSFLDKFRDLFLPVQSHDVPILG